MTTSNHDGIDDVRWVQVNDLKAPNFTSNISAVTTSVVAGFLSKYGWFQPIIVDADYNIIHGYEYWYAMKFNERLNKKYHDMVPVVIFHCKAPHISDFLGLYLNDSTSNFNKDKILQKLVSEKLCSDDVLADILGMDTQSFKEIEFNSVSQ